MSIDDIFIGEWMKVAVTMAVNDAKEEKRIVFGHRAHTVSLISTARRHITLWLIVRFRSTFSRPTEPFPRRPFIFPALVSLFLLDLNKKAEKSTTFPLVSLEIFVTLNCELSYVLQSILLFHQRELSTNVFYNQIDDTQAQRKWYDIDFSLIIRSITFPLDRNSEWNSFDDNIE